MREAVDFFLGAFELSETVAIIFYILLNFCMEGWHGGWGM